MPQFITFPVGKKSQVAQNAKAIAYVLMSLRIFCVNPFDVLYKAEYSADKIEFDKSLDASVICWLLLDVTLTLAAKIEKKRQNHL